MDELIVDGGRPAVARVAALPASWTTEADRLVLLALACDSFDGDTSAPGADNLAGWTGLGRSTVYDVLRRLQRATDERPALLAVDETTRGRRRTRYRLTLPAEPEQPSSPPDGSLPTTVQRAGRFNRPATVQQPSSPPDGSTPPTVQQPSSSPDAPSPSDNPPPRRRSAAELKVRTALLAKGVTQGHVDAAIDYAVADPETKSLARLTKDDRYLSEAVAAVAAGHQRARGAAAARQLDELRASDADAARAIDRLADSYVGKQAELLAAVLADLADNAVEHRIETPGQGTYSMPPTPAPDPTPALDGFRLHGPRLAVVGAS